MKYTLWMLMAVMTFGTGAARADEISDAAFKLLAQFGAVEYALKDAYGGGIDRMYLGYDGDGNIAVGVAVRETKTYKKVHTLAVVTPSEKGYKIAAAEAPDMNRIPGKANDYVSEALKDIAGKTFDSSDAARGLVDAVSGATRYYKSIYVSYSLMASKLIEEMTKQPDWERKTLPST